MQPFSRRDSAWSTRMKRPGTSHLNSTAQAPPGATAEQQAKVHQLRMLLEAEGVTERLDSLTLVWNPKLG